MARAPRTTVVADNALDRYPWHHNTDLCLHRRPNRHLRSELLMMNQTALKLSPLTSRAFPMLGIAKNYCYAQASCTVARRLNLLALPLIARQSRVPSGTPVTSLVRSLSIQVHQSPIYFCSINVRGLLRVVFLHVRRRRTSLVPKRGDEPCSALTRPNQKSMEQMQ